MVRQTLDRPSASLPGEMPVDEAGPIEAPMPNGAAVAAILAAAIGCAVLGILVTLAAASSGFASRLNWWNPGGPLVGKTSVSVIAYFASWFVLHRMWRDRDVAFDTIWKVSLVLLAVGFIGTFPLFFELFIAH